MTKTLIRRCVAALLGMLIATAMPAVAQDAAQPTAQLRAVEADVRAIDKQSAGDISTKDRSILRARLTTSRQTAAAVAEQLSGQLTAVDARIAELGPPPPGAAEAPEVRSQRAKLAAERLAIDAAVKRARLLDVEAGQLATEMQRADAQQFGARIARRTASPFTPAFWGAVYASFDDDVARIGKFFAEGEQRMRAQGLLFVLLALGLAFVLVGPARLGALRLGQRYLISDAPGHRLRRSAYALWAMIVGTVMPVLAALVVVMGAGLGQMLSPTWTGLIQAFIGAIGFSAFAAAALGAVLMRSQPSWRIAPISDAVAQRLRPLSWILAIITFFEAMIAAFNAAVGASAAAMAASTAVQTGADLILIGGALLATGRLRAAEADREDAVEVSPALGLIALVLWLMVIASFCALTLGYLELGQFLVTMIIWPTVLSAATYLILAVVDDAAVGLFNRDSGLGRTLVRGVGLRGSAIDQFGVLLSGAMRLGIGLIALILLMAPFSTGTGIGAMLEKIASVADGITIGGITVSPGTILRGLIVFVIGLTLVRGFMAWLEGRYLPATDLDGSGRNSVSLIARYVGFALAAIWALASLGIGVEKIALLLSALSVGIGFGLQAITQNFVSGLILLTERPIKIGDLIKVGNDEGDVKRISVRSTELELADHSTLIIPNSELITKPVLNKTLSSPLGRVQIQFSVPISTDTDKVEHILLDCFAGDEAILDKPAPVVFIDSIVDGRTLFNSLAHVSGPRAAYRARSNVLKAVMRRLREEGIEIGTPPVAPTV